jgi:hypothetical protein
VPAGAAGEAQALKDKDRIKRKERNFNLVRMVEFFWPNYGGAG